MKRVFVLFGVLSVLSPLMLLAGCGEKVSQEEAEAAKNAANVTATKSGATENPNKPKLAPPPP